MFVYFPVYYVALLAGKYRKKEVLTGEAKSILKKFNVVGFMAACFAYNFLYSSGVRTLLQAFVALTSVNVVLWISRVISIKPFQAVIGFLSYSSLCIYLFHNQVLWVGELIFGKLSILIAYLLLLPILIMLSYLLQKNYDMFLSVKFERSKASKETR